MFRNLGGMVINIANWWVDECTQTANPQTAAERARWNDRRTMEQRYNFRVMGFSKYHGKP
jgi:hypothetical protein